MINAALLAAMLASGTPSPLQVLKSAYEAASTPASLQDFDAFGTKAPAHKCVTVAVSDPNSVGESDTLLRYTVNVPSYGPLLPPHAKELLMFGEYDPANPQYDKDSAEYLDSVVQSEVIETTKTDLHVEASPPNNHATLDIRRSGDIDLYHIKSKVIDEGYGYCWKK